MLFLGKIIRHNINIGASARSIWNSYSEIYSRDKNNTVFEFIIPDGLDVSSRVLFKFLKSRSIWEALATVEDNKISVKFDSSLITQDEQVRGYVYLFETDKSHDIFEFKFNVRLSELDKENQLTKEPRYIQDSAGGLSKEEVVEIIKANFSLEEYAKKSELPISVDVSGKVDRSELEGYVKKTDLLDSANNDNLINRISTLESKVEKIPKQNLAIKGIVNDEHDFDMTADYDNDGDGINDVYTPIYGDPLDGLSYIPNTNFLMNYFIHRDFLINEEEDLNKVVNGYYNGNGYHSIPSIGYLNLKLYNISEDSAIVNKLKEKFDNHYSSISLVSRVDNLEARINALETEKSNLQNQLLDVLNRLSASESR